MTNKEQKIQARAEYHTKFSGKRKLPKSARADRAKRESARNAANRARNETPVRLLNWPFPPVGRE